MKIHFKLAKLLSKVLQLVKKTRNVTIESVGCKLPISDSYMTSTGKWIKEWTLSSG